MKIDSSVIGMESARRYTSSQKRTAKFAVMDYKGKEAHEEKTNKEEDGEEPVMELKERVNLMRTNRINLKASGQTAMDSLRQQAIRSLFAMIFGIERTDKIFGDSISGKYTMEQVSPNQNSLSLVVSEEFYYEESEQTSFDATGLVKTADGREIAINLNVNMSRRFSEYYKNEMQVMKVNTCDPLVLNFDGGAPELSDQKFFFDLDADGEEEKISMLGSGSGYLALDRNEDGKINDGSELFGPDSGDGFRDLAAFDEDGNGWIDENDSIFEKLKIWCQDEEGNSVLYTLKEKNVGAICLHNVSTDFSLNGADNVTNGIVKSTGLFLYESGLAGTIQHLDLAQ